MYVCNKLLGEKEIERERERDAPVSSQVSEMHSMFFWNWKQFDFEIIYS